MENEEQEERVPNFIGYAVIILTAHHLDCEVEMLATAQEVWRTKVCPNKCCRACTGERHVRPWLQFRREVWQNRQTVSERYFTARGNFHFRTVSSNNKK